MKKILIVLLVVYGSLSAQNKIKFNIDYAVFPADSNGGIIEFYYVFTHGGLKIVKHDSSSYTEGYFKISVSEKNTKKEVLKRSFKFSSEYDSLKTDKSEIGILSFPFLSGKYSCVALLKDKNSTAESEPMRFDFVVKGLPNDKLMISDIQVASKLMQNCPDKNSIFYKNTFEVVPNVENIFGINSPVLFFYAELHNLDKNIKADKLKIDHILVNSRKEPVYKKTKYYSKNKNAIVDVDAIKVIKFSSGMYNLIVSATDTVTNFNVASVKKVFIYNPSILDTSTHVTNRNNILTSEFASLSMDELKLMFEQSKYIATQTEIDKWETIKTIEGKQAYLYKFWNSRDQDKYASQAEYKEAYFKRVNYANTHFTNMMQKQGWKSDFGRVYITYGEPDEIERFPNSSNIKPYEIWKYNNLESGVIFVFGDDSGFGRYRLLHSTKRGELEDANWQKRISGF